MSTSKRTATQIYHSALSSVEEARYIIDDPLSSFEDRYTARKIRDCYLSTIDDITLLEHLRRAAAEEVESQERTL